MVTWAHQHCAVTNSTPIGASFNRYECTWSSHSNIRSEAVIKTDWSIRSEAVIQAGGWGCAYRSSRQPLTNEHHGTSVFCNATHAYCRDVRMVQRANLPQSAQAYSHQPVPVICVSPLCVSDAISGPIQCWELDPLQHYILSLPLHFLEC